jgi:hypothetical protein
VKWILAAGLAVMVATIVYAWWRGGEEAGSAVLALCA